MTKIVHSLVCKHIFWHIKNPIGYPEIDWYLASFRILILQLSQNGI